MIRVNIQKWEGAGSNDIRNYVERDRSVLLLEFIHSLSTIKTDVFPVPYKIVPTRVGRLRSQKGEKFARV